MRNSKGVALQFLGGDCGRLGDPCGHPELPRRDADEALEVMAEHALVREAGVRGDLRQGQVCSCLQKLLGPLDAAHDDVLVRRQPGGPLELPGEVVGAEAGDRGNTSSRPRSGRRGARAWRMGGIGRSTGEQSNVHEGTGPLRAEEDPSLSRLRTTPGPRAVSSFHLSRDRPGWRTGRPGRRGRTDGRPGPLARRPRGSLQHAQSPAGPSRRPAGPAGAEPSMPRC
jgi:hypothetical protein